MKKESPPPAWPSMADLLTSDGNADVALIGAPMEAGSITPGRCDLAPALIRKALRRLSNYDVETRQELKLPIRDEGNLAVEGLTPEAGFEPIRDALLRCTAEHRLTILLGGNNAVTRPAAHGLGLDATKTGLITLDAHFDLRDTSGGLLNGNPVRALLEDGLPGANICQIGLAPFANVAEMHNIADRAGIAITTIGECKSLGILPVLERALERLAHVEAIIVDFDVDVIDRSQCPGAPGARPGGMPVEMFFAAARHLGAQAQVRLVDFTEFDPSLDVADIGALTGARWICEIMAGFGRRQGGRT